VNKLMGFFELKELGLPTVKFCEYNGDIKLDPRLLWTVRTAVYKGNDLNLPRAVGVTAEEAERIAREFYSRLQNKGIVIYYPYFIAEKSGTLEVSNTRIVIEAVEGDLWRLVTEGERNVTIIIGEGGKLIKGQEDFLDSTELDDILQHISVIRLKFRDLLFEGKSILLEWSFAYNTDTNRRPLNGKYLVFYEIRAV